MAKKREVLSKKIAVLKVMEAKQLRLTRTAALKSQADQTNVEADAAMWDAWGRLGMLRAEKTRLRLLRRRVKRTTRKTQRSARQRQARSTR